jgi:hypothetical protein
MTKVAAIYRFCSPPRLWTVSVFHGITLAALVRMRAEGGGDHVVELDPDQSGGTVRRP